MDNLCPPGTAIPHGVKVFLAAFVLGYQMIPRPEKHCKKEKQLNDKNLMESFFDLAPYHYNITSRNPPGSSDELDRMKSKEEYLKVNPPKITKDPNMNYRIRYDYGKMFHRLYL